MIRKRRPRSSSPLDGLPASARELTRVSTLPWGVDSGVMEDRRAAEVSSSSCKKRGSNWRPPGCDLGESLCDRLRMRAVSPNGAALGALLAVDPDPDVAEDLVRGPVGLVDAKVDVLGCDRVGGAC